MADNQIQMEFVIDDKSVKTQFAKIEDQSDKTGKKVQSDLGKKTLVDFAAGIFVAEKAFKALSFAASKVVATIEKSIDLAVEAEAANIKLASAFATLRPEARKTEQAFRDFASALQGKVAIDDDFIKSNASVLVSLGRLSGEGLEKATLAALNLAKGIDVDASSAFLLLAKAANGSVESLSRYGLRVDQNLTKSQKFEAVLKQIEERFGGLAAAEVNTFAGASKAVSLAFDDLLQAFGEVITKSPALVSVLKTILAEIESITASVVGATGGRDALKPFLVGILEVGQAINNYFIMPLELGFNLVRTGVLSVYAGIQGLIAIFVKFGDVVNKLVFEPIISGFGFLSEKVIGLFNKDLAAKVGANISEFGQTFGSSLDPLVESTSAVFDDAFSALADSADNTFKSKIGGSIDSFLEKLKSAANDSKAITSVMSSGVAAETETMSDAFRRAQEQIDQAIRQGIVQSISGGLAQIGANLQKGANAFDNFGNVILGILGDLAIQVGTILIGMGLGIEQLKVALATFNGAALVAAGAALVVLGGALKSLSGGASAIGGGAAAGGAPGAAGGIGATPVQETEAQPRGINVQLNISGDVFDTDETGLRIVDILNKSFDQQGVTIRGGVA